MGAEVKVIGLVSGTHVLEDIGRDVPYGTLVTISASEAALSKDLWRGISQRCLLQLPTVPPPPPAPFSAVPVFTDESLARRMNDLESKISALEAENRKLRKKGAVEPSGPAAVSAAYEEKLDLILAQLQNSRSLVVTDHRPAKTRNTDVVDGSAPTFLPSEITPRNVEAHIDVVEETAAGHGVSDAAERLRKLRNKTQE